MLGVALVSVQQHLPAGLTRRQRRRDAQRPPHGPAVIVKPLPESCHEPVHDQLITTISCRCKLMAVLMTRLVAAQILVLIAHLSATVGIK